MLYHVGTITVQQFFKIPQTPDGRPKSFYVKEVHPDTLGWKAGVLSKDRIVQVSVCTGTVVRLLGYMLGHYSTKHLKLLSTESSWFV